MSDTPTPTPPPDADDPTVDDSIAPELVDLIPPVAADVSGALLAGSFAEDRRYALPPGTVPSVDPSEWPD